MEAPPPLTAGAVTEIWELPNGPATFQPVLQVADLRPVVAKNTTAAAAAAQHSERFRMLLSDGVHSQQSMLGTGLNDLIKDGTLRVGSIVHLTDMTCNTIQKRRCVNRHLFSPFALDWILICLPGLVLGCRFVRGTSDFSKGGIFVLVS
ncbi:unnamed protein product [Triticum turgidum subsp. durum]|uniref:Replication factor-A protein 1 N-terminal domain-containing protein n=1 Tax=Triticum turgidum subsp. durum TaxID=4567 RepID=A0A9R0Q176_TRITD|nr:unnamed protein product [Triticum turgidum subsp. durum]